MVMTTDKAQRSIFVGNIPYDVSESKLKEIFSKVGPISSFRLVYDKETGKPKGYGFCEYCDLETAQSALRNLANCDVNGRPLRVGPAAGEQHFDNPPQSNFLQPATPATQQSSAVIPSLPDWSDPSKVTQSIVETVHSMSPESLSEVLRNFKYFAVSNPSEARVMLSQNSPLAYALLQSMVVLGVVDTQTLPSLFHTPGNKDSISMHHSAGPQSYEPVFVGNAPRNNAGDYRKYEHPREYYNPVPYCSPLDENVPEHYNPDSAYRRPPNEGYAPHRKRKGRTNFDPRNLPRFSTSVLKSLSSGSRGRSLDEQERSGVVSQLRDLSDEQIERYLPREQIDLAFSIKRRYN